MNLYIYTYVHCMYIYICMYVYVCITGVRGAAEGLG